MSSLVCCCCCCCCFWFLIFFSSPSSVVFVSCSNTIEIPLSSSDELLLLLSDPYLYMSHLASTSSNRAKHLTTMNAPLYSHSYGGYSISLSFGTPPQASSSLIMDTASDLVWFPCTHTYRCKDCSSANIQPFIPKLSSSSKLIGCLNPKCDWIHPSDAARCTDCPTSTNCTQICPPYLLFYASGSTGGVLLSETLHFPNHPPVHDFVLGCSLFSSHQPAGIAGFGRGPASLPAQLALDQFSFCLPSHRFDDDSTKTTSMTFISGSHSALKTTGVSYTPFLENPVVAGKHAFSVYYYVGLRRIIVGGKRVKIPYKYLWPESDGSGGTIVDSGTTFTFMTRKVFHLVASEFIAQVDNKYERATEIEDRTGLQPCFNFTGQKKLSLPELKFHFKGGAEMRLPLANYFLIPDNSGVACLGIVTDGVDSVDFAGGPSIILGNFQMQNYYVEYDLRNERLGFRQQKCL